ncbi:Sulfotransferase domain-containing protein [Ekhidna lutea]|uniref:Sulfotransferase domain-containing protein n=1 Tax=Ekhidna lutea TaxID=447679 RepID=A0A239FGX6_EKHLU|nr:sulfotransferase domain-containing protein [Ekhidna lutea]SNS56280.1 Sulfotransferase domain-containing protein [Ekhidna lutea]
MIGKIRVFFGSKIPRNLKHKIKFEWFPFVSIFYPETLIVSYPKCGRSWLRLLINDSFAKEYSGHLKEGSLQEDRLSSINKDISSIGITHDDDPMLKTPEEIIKNKSFYKKKNVVLLVRDPRDVMISWYFQVINRGSIKNFSEPIKTNDPRDFIYNERGGLKTIIDFYNLWWKNRERPKSFYCMSYEALRSDTLNEMIKLFEFWGIRKYISDSSIKHAIQKNSFEKLKDKESKGAVKHDAFKTVDKKNPDAFKARKGKVGGYVDYLETEDIKYMDDLISKTLNKAYKY